MSTPSITNVYPAVGAASGGTLVRLLGADFASNVSVEFGGVAARTAFSTRHALAYAVVPPAQTVPGAVDVVLRNLDSEGIPVPGEVATMSDAFEYALPKLSIDGDLGMVVRALVETMQRRVMPEVVLRRHVDYAGEADVAVGRVQVAKLPSIVLVGPSIVPTLGEETNERTIVDVAPGLHAMKRPPIACDVQFRLVGAANNTRHHVEMLDAVLSVFGRGATLRVARSSIDGSMGFVEYDVDYVPGGWPTIIETPNESNVTAFSGQLTVHDVRLGWTSSVEADACEHALGAIPDPLRSGVTMSTYGTTQSAEPIRRGGGT